MTYRPARTVAFLVFDGVRVLDFAGPFDVFAITNGPADDGDFRLRLVALENRPIVAAKGLRVVPDCTLANCESPDIVVVPGGPGSRTAMDSDDIVSWVDAASRQAEMVLSVCGGARILARAGMLDGLRAVTHRGAIQEIRRLAPTVHIQEDARVVDAGRIVTTGGISAGIDGALHVVARLLGEARARATADQMEYPWPGASPR